MSAKCKLKNHKTRFKINKRKKFKKTKIEKSMIFSKGCKNVY